MTEKIYEKRSYLRELSTVVTDSFSEDDKNYIKLKETIFFPEEGGQYSDTGTVEYEGKAFEFPYNPKGITHAPEYSWQFDRDRHGDNPYRQGEPEIFCEVEEIEPVHVGD